MLTKEDINKLTIDDFKKYENIPWEHGNTDCYALIRLVYTEIFGIHLNDYDRHGDWWRFPEQFNLYKDNYEKEGFFKIKITKKNPLQIGDAILMNIGYNIPIHAAIYIGNNYILHHYYKRLSSIESYNGIWLDTTTEIIRHKDLSFK